MAEAVALVLVALLLVVVYEIILGERVAVLMAVVKGGGDGGGDAGGGDDGGWKGGGGERVRPGVVGPWVALAWNRADCIQGLKLDTNATKANKLTRCTASAIMAISSHVPPTSPRCSNPTRRNKNQCEALWNSPIFSKVSNTAKASWASHQLSFRSLRRRSNMWALFYPTMWGCDSAFFLLGRKPGLNSPLETRR